LLIAMFSSFLKYLPMSRISEICCLEREGEVTEEIVEVEAIKQMDR
jgi:hypothetical protein